MLRCLPQHLFPLNLWTGTCPPLRVLWNVSFRPFLGIFCFVALFGWTVWNLIQNWKDRAEILINAGWALLIIAVGYGIVYGAMQILL